jgi:hypothetical protein
MSLGRAYTADSGVVGVASGSQAILLWGYPTLATASMDIEAIRVSVLGATSFPSNASVACTLARTTGTPSGGAAITPNPHNPADQIAASTWKSGSTALTGFSVGVVVWEQNIPFTAGANWAEWVTPGAEWRVVGSATAGSGIAVYVTCSSAGTGTTFQCEVVFAE